MRVPEEIRKCVAFLMWSNGDKEGFMGTVFFVWMPLPNLQNKSALYAVTAGHVIRKIEELCDKGIADGRVYFRLNSGTSIVMKYNRIHDWYFHPDDPDVDVAVSRMRFNGMDHIAYPTDAFVTEDVLKEEQIEVGEDVFIAGLFNQHAGVSKNIPILRIGTIAAMPEEPVNTSLGPMQAYLVETRSIGGLSGSPVFIHLGSFRKRHGEIMISDNDEGAHRLLGVMHGHWDLAIPDIFPIAPRDENLKVKVNSGIGIVAPATKILEVLNQPELVEERKRAEEAIKDRMETAP